MKPRKYEFAAAANSNCGNQQCEICEKGGVLLESALELLKNLVTSFTLSTTRKRNIQRVETGKMILKMEALRKRKKNIAHALHLQMMHAF